MVTRIPLPGPRRRRPRLPLSAIARDSLRRICCWGDQSRLWVFWRRVSRVFNGSARRVVKITRVRQTNGVVRFDVYCRQEDHRFVRARMQRFVRRWGWYLRDHRPYRVRKMGRAPAASLRRVGSQLPNDPIMLGTLNVHGLLSKAEVVSDLLTRRGVGILALQETTLGRLDRQPDFPGYRAYHAFGGRVESDRGCSLLVAERLAASQVGSMSACMLSVRLGGASTGSPSMVVTAAYLPSRSQGAPYRAALRSELLRLRRRYPRDTLVVMGDWNLDEGGMHTLLAGWHNALPGAHTLWPSEEEVSRALGGTRRQGNRKVDHIVAWPASPDSVPYNIFIDLESDISDHYPVFAKVHTPLGVERTARLPVRELIQADKIPVPPAGTPETEWPLKFANFVHANPFAVLADMTDVTDSQPNGVGARQATVDHLAEEFGKAVKVACREAEAIVVAHSRHRPPPLPTAIVGAIARRRRCFVQWQACVRTGVGAPLALSRYLAEKKAVAQKVRENKRRAEERAVRKATSDFRQGDSRRFWRWTKSVRRAEDPLSGSHPVRDGSGIVRSSPDEIASCWKDHYTELLKDPYPSEVRAERYREAWTRRYGSRAPQPMFQDINEEIMAEDVRVAILRLRQKKAAGEDNIPADILRLASAAPDSPYMRALVRVVNSIWTGGCVPTGSRNSILVSVPKPGGDPSEMRDYRGISVMGSVMKLLMTIISNRIYDACEERGLFRPSQAGFRFKEEAPAQVACLHEIATRRQNRRLATYAAFVDFKAAYDTVPHELLFKKLEMMGFRGRILSFLRELYGMSFVKIRTGTAPDYRFSAPVPLERGLRQGCPASPVLFNLFINDIFDGAEDWGCGVPECSAAGMVPGLLYADDAVALSPSLDAFGSMLRHLDRWASDHFMSFGIRKCGVMALGRHCDVVALRARSHEWTLGGCPVEIVEAYKYLGSMVHSDLSLDKMAADRAVRGGRVLRALSAYLRHKLTPPDLKLLAVRAMLMPVVTYGCEVWGGSGSRSAQHQNVVNEAARMVAGIGRKSTIALAPLLRELNLPPVASFAAGQRARLYQKAPELRTYIGYFVQYPSTGRMVPWAQGTRRMLELWAAKVVDSRGPEPATWWEAMEPRALFTMVRNGDWELWEQQQSKVRSGTRWAPVPPVPDNKSRYFTAGFGNTPLLPLIKSLPRGALPGLKVMLLLRLRAYPTLDRLVTIGAVSGRYESFCPSCLTPRRETLDHMISDCGVYDALRSHLEQSTEVLSAIGRYATNTREAVDILLGGNRPDLMSKEQWDKDMFKVWKDSLPCICEFFSDLHTNRMQLLRRRGVGTLVSTDRCGRPGASHRGLPLNEPMPDGVG